MPFRRSQHPGESKAWRKPTPRLDSSGAVEGETVNTRTKLGLAAASVAALALSSCGSNSLGGGPPAGSSAPSVSVSQNADLSAKLPESIKSAGVIKIGVDAT